VTSESDGAVEVEAGGPRALACGANASWAGADKGALGDDWETGGRREALGDGEPESASVWESGRLGPEPDESIGDGELMQSTERKRDGNRGASDGGPWRYLKVARLDRQKAFQG
jgi:hypothetical protein